MFADDRVILTHTNAEATDIIYHIAQSYSLRINVDKTKL